MRKLLKIAIVALGIRAFLRWRKRKRAEAAAVADTQASSDPAEELRRKLAESRDSEAADEPAPPPEATVADRRAEVHEQGRAALDDMKSHDEG